jgi:hypothetical protein
MYRPTKLIAYNKLGREQTIACIKELRTQEYGTQDIYSISLSVLGH